VFLVRQPKATQRAVRMALFPPAPPRRRRREGHHSSGGTAINGERDGGLGFGRRTSVLADDEIDVLAELDVEAGVAHEVLQPDAGDRPRCHRRRTRDASSLFPLVGGKLEPVAGVLFGGSGCFSLGRSPPEGQNPPK